MDGQVIINVPFHQLMVAMGDCIEKMLSREDAGHIFSRRNVDQFRKWADLIETDINISEGKDP